MSNLFSSHCLTCILIHNWEILGVSKKQNVANIWIILNCSSGSSRFKSKILNILDTSHGQSYAARDCLSCARSSVSSAGRVVTGLGWFIHGTWGCHDYNGDLVVQQPRMMINKSWVDGDLDWFSHFLKRFHQGKWDLNHGLPDVIFEITLWCHAFHMASCWEVRPNEIHEGELERKPSVYAEFSCMLLIWPWCWLKKTWKDQLLHGEKAWVFFQLGIYIKIIKVNIHGLTQGHSLKDTSDP